MNYYDRLAIMTTQETRLKDIAIIAIGSTFRERMEASANGSVRVIQMKDLSGDNEVDTKKMIRINAAVPKTRQLVHKGDLIFRSRGNIRTAAIMNEDIPNTIAAAPLLKITASRQHALPGYLLWWINSPASQSYFNANSEGTLLQMVKINVLGNLQVTLPPLERQKYIQDYFLLHNKEQRILKQLTAYKKQHAEKVLMLMAHNTTNDKPQTTRPA